MDKCIYSNDIAGESDAVSHCVVCNAGLCVFCGYIKDDEHYCNECYSKLEKK